MLQIKYMFLFLYNYARVTLDYATNILSVLITKKINQNKAKQILVTYFSCLANLSTTNSHITQLAISLSDEDNQGSNPLTSTTELSKNK